MNKKLYPDLRWMEDSQFGSLFLKLELSKKKKEKVPEEHADDSDYLEED